MSLLLQALQKAARNREGQGPASDEHDAEAPGTRLPDGAAEPTLSSAPRHEARSVADLDELSLADEDELFGPDVPVASAREPHLGLPGAADEPAPSVAVRAAPAKPEPREAAGPAHAATILRASESRDSGMLDWVRDRPVHAFAIVGGIFGVFYGAYVYLQIFHPAILRGDFMRQPALQAKTPPPPPPRPLTPPEPVAAAPQPAGPAAPVVATAAPGPETAMPAKPAAAKDRGSPPRSAARTPVRKADADDTTADDAAGADEMPDAPPARPTPPRRAARKPQVEVDKVTLDDSVAVRTPESRIAPTAATLTRAWEALQAGRYEQAQTLYDEVANADPASVDALLGLGALASVRGNAEQAARHYGRALELDPRNAAAQAGLISVMGQADPQLSESRLKQLLAREPSAFAYFALGNLYARQALWPQAQQAYFQAYQLQPDNPDYAYNLAVGLEHLGQSKIALNYYRRALELSTLRGRAEFDRTRVEERIGQLAARVGNQ